MSSWLSLAADLQIRAAALFDGDEEGLKALANANERFITNPNVLLRALPTQDIRDKSKSHGDHKDVSGVFDISWNLKQEYANWWSAFLEDVTNFLRPTVVVPPVATETTSTQGEVRDVV